MARIAFKAGLQSVGNNNTVVYQVPAEAKFASLSISIVNSEASESKATVYISNLDNPSVSDMVECELVFTKKGTKLRSAFETVLPGEKIVIFANSSNLAIRVSGVYETE